MFDANNFARQYLKEMGELDNLKDKKPVAIQEVKRKRSRHQFILFSTKRNQWFVKVKGPAGSKIVGFYDTEDEAVAARDNYLKARKENREKLRPRFKKDEKDSAIKFHERSNQWTVIVKNKRGGFKKLGFYETEEEAIAAKNEYYGIVTEEVLSIEDDNDENAELEFDFGPTFNEGDRVQIISGPLEFELGVITGYNTERDAFIVKLENPASTGFIFIKADYLKLI